jgi:excisionase family DNA binding protein
MNTNDNSGEQRRSLAVDLAEASRLSTLSRRTLENYIRVKRLRARKVGRRTLILMRDLEAFLRSDQPSPKLGKRDA